MKKPEELEEEEANRMRLINKQIAGLMTREELAAFLLKIAPDVVDWGKIELLPIDPTKTRTLDRIKHLAEENKERRAHNKPGPKSKRAGRYTKEEWIKKQNRERAARYRARRKQERTQENDDL